MPIAQVKTVVDSMRTEVISTIFKYSMVKNLKYNNKNSSPGKPWGNRDMRIYREPDYQSLLWERKSFIQPKSSDFSFSYFDITSMLRVI